MYTYMDIHVNVATADNTLLIKAAYSLQLSLNIALKITSDQWLQTVHVYLLLNHISMYEFLNNTKIHVHVLILSIVLYMYHILLQSL